MFLGTPLIEKRVSGSSATRICFNLAASFGDENQVGVVAVRRERPSDFRQKLNHRVESPWSREVPSSVKVTDRTGWKFWPASAGLAWIAMRLLCQHCGSRLRSPLMSEIRKAMPRSRRLLKITFQAYPDF